MRTRTALLSLGLGVVAAAGIYFSPAAPLHPVDAATPLPVPISEAISQPNLDKPAEVVPRCTEDDYNDGSVPVCYTIRVTDDAIVLLYPES